MDNKYLEKLEFNNIKKMLANLTNTFEGKKLANTLIPSSNSLEVQSMLSETSDSVNLINERGNFPISSIEDWKVTCLCLQKAYYHWIIFEELLENYLNIMKAILLLWTITFLHFTLIKMWKIK